MGRFILQLFNVALSTELVI